jgi:Flp pilus assembly protein TadD
MKNVFRFKRRIFVIALLCVFLAALLSGCIWYLRPGGAEARTTKEAVVTLTDGSEPDETNPGVAAAMALRARHHDTLMTLPHVVGTAVGLAAGEKPAVIVFTKEAPQAGVIPDSLD